MNGRPGVKLCAATGLKFCFMLPPLSATGRLEGSASGSNAMPLLKPSRLRSQARAKAWCIAAMVAAPWVAAVPARANNTVVHAGRFADGGIVPEGAIQKWHAANAQPTFADRAIFDAGNPLRWAIRVNPAAALGGQTPAAGPYVELVTGDRLPGRVEEYRSGRESLGERLPPHLLVRPTAVAGPPGQPEPPVVRVRTSFVSRVVHEPRAGRPARPGTLRLKDGREIEYRSLRWVNQGVLVLSADGPARAGFQDVVDLRLPAGDPWASYFDVIAALTPDLTNSLVRSETADGLVVTTAISRILAAGSENDPLSWEHRLEPAWSLDPIRVSHANVTNRWFFPAHEVPLPLIEAARVERRSVFGGAWNWETNRSVRGSPLAAGGLPYGWGFGVQAACDLLFPLPAIATGFRGGVALDQVAGTGGCVRARVGVDSPTAQPVWKSDLLVGTRQPVDTGVISLRPRADGTSLLVLSADDAHTGRPPGADPFDIRDTLDWLDPVVLLDPARLAETVRSRIPATIPAWDGWAVVVPPGASLAVRDTVGPWGCTRLVAPTAGELVLRRSLAVDERSQFILVGVSRAPGTSPSRIEIRVDGRALAATDVPERPADSPPAPFRVPLTAFQGRTVNLEVAHLPADAGGMVDWHCLDPISDLSSVWEPLEIVDVTSQGGAAYRRLEDGSMLAEGPSPPTDVLTVRLRTPLEGITALRLDALGHDSLPSGGPGRFSNGDFIFTDCEADAFALEKPPRRTPLEFAAAVASQQGPRFPAAAIIDGNPVSGWSCQGHESAVMLVLANRAGFAGGTDLIVKLSFRHGPLPQHVLGRFRLSATTSATPTLESPGRLLEGLPPAP